MRTGLALLSVAAFLAPSAARADEPHATLAFALPPQRLIGGAMSGGGGGRAHPGVFLGVDGGWATLLATGDHATGAWTFGVRAGYQLASGLAVQARYDDLGVDVPLSDRDGGVLQIASFGLRYSVPTFFVAPFGEAMVGPAFYDGGAVLSGGFGLGMALPVARHFAFELAARDWLVPIDGRVHQALAINLGATVSFASP